MPLSLLCSLPGCSPPLCRLQFGPPHPPPRALIDLGLTPSPSFCTLQFPERWSAPCRTFAGVSDCLFLICILSPPPLQTVSGLQAALGLRIINLQGRRPRKAADPIPSAARKTRLNFICLMTTATHICNHALTVYKAVFTPISSTDANSTSLSCQPAWQQWKLHFSEGETGAQRGEKCTYPRTHSRFGGRCMAATSLQSPDSSRSLPI